MAFVGDRPIPSGCLIQHGDWDNRTTNPPPEFWGLITISGTNSFYPLSEIPAENTGRITDLNINSQHMAFGKLVEVLKDQVGDSTVAAGGVFGNKNIVDNLQGAINGELHEVNQMYMVYYETAKIQNESEAQKSFLYALEAEKIHAKMFQYAQDQAKDGKDITDESVYICPICGFTEIGDNADKCPVCGAKREIFKKF
jgi:rubrerythrin